MPTTTSSRPFRWYIPDAYIPPGSTGSEVSHESICVLNDTDFYASMTVTAYFADRDPLSSAPIVVEARRAVHLRTDKPADVGGLQLGRGIPYGMVIESDADIKL